MKIRASILAGLLSFALLAAACGGGGGGGGGPVTTVNPSGSHAPVTLNVWSYFAQREGRDLEAAIQPFLQAYPWIHVNIVPAKADADFVRGINSGVPIDVAIVSTPTDLPKFCSTGGYLDLTPYIKADGMDVSSIFPPAVQQYTSWEGKQCAFPFLTDTFGLYYNTDMFKAAGITSPPKTMSELAADAKKLTVKNPDGSIKVAGFMPLNTFYENGSLYAGNNWGTKWYNDDGTSAFATDPAWKSLLTWDKELVDFMGYDNLAKFYQQLGGPNSEWNSAQGFETGKVAMHFDGEWRESFITNDKAKIHYATAPFPVADDHPELYGSGLTGGTIMAIPKTSTNPGVAWLALKFMTTDTKLLSTFAEALRNVPTTFESLKDPVLVNDPIFKTFLELYKNKLTHEQPWSTFATADAGLWSAFLSKWEGGQISASDLDAELQKLASNIDAQHQLG